MLEKLIALSFFHKNVSKNSS